MIKVIGGNAFLACYWLNKLDCKSLEFWYSLLGISHPLSCLKGLTVCRILKTQKSERFLPAVLLNSQNACTDTEMSFDKITSIFSSLEKKMIWLLVIILIHKIFTIQLVCVRE